MARAECTQGYRGGPYKRHQKRAHAKACRKEGRLRLDAPPRNRYRGWAL